MRFISHCDRLFYLKQGFVFGSYYLGIQGGHYIIIRIMINNETSLLFQMFYDEVATVMQDTMVKYINTQKKTLDNRISCLLQKLWAAEITTDMVEKIYLVMQ